MLPEEGMLLHSISPQAFAGMVAGQNKFDGIFRCILARKELVIYSEINIYNYCLQNNYH